MYVFLEFPKYPMNLTLRNVDVKVGRRYFQANFHREF
jgi:hypothetical protein